MSRRTLNLVQWQVLNPIGDETKIMPIRNAVKVRAREVKREPDLRSSRKIMLRRYDMGNSELSLWSPLALGLMSMPMALQDKLAEAKERIWHDEMSYLRVADSLR